MVVRKYSGSSVLPSAGRSKTLNAQHDELRWRQDACSILKIRNVIGTLRKHSVLVLSSREKVYTESKNPLQLFFGEHPRVSASSFCFFLPW